MAFNHEVNGYTMMRQDVIPNALNSQSPIPLYRQLADILAARIRCGQYPVGQRIPSEHLLAETFGIGRPTVRQATDFLVRKGLLVRKRGAGTFVRAAQNDIDLFSLGGTLSAFEKEGIAVSTMMPEPVRLMRVPLCDGHPFSERTAFFYRRISSVDLQPVLLEEMYLDPTFLPGLDAMALAGKSISTIVADTYHLTPSSGRQAFTVTTIGADRRRCLDVPAHTPVLKVRRFLHFPQGQNLVYAELYCLTDRFSFSQVLGTGNGN